MKSIYSLSEHIQRMHIITHGGGVGEETQMQYTSYSSVAKSYTPLLHSVNNHLWQPRYCMCFCKLIYTWEAE